MDLKNFVSDELRKVLEEDPQLFWSIFFGGFFYGVLEIFRHFLVVVESQVGTTGNLSRSTSNESTII